MTQTIRFTVLGGGPEVLPMLEVVRTTPSFDLAGWCDSPEIAPWLREQFPRASALPTSDAMGPDGNTVVLVGAGKQSPTHEALMRQLARDGVPMVLVQPACSAIFAMELEMIQRDTGAPMIPFHPASLHPVMDQFQAWTQDTAPPIGRVEQVVIERTAPQRDNPSVLELLSRDAMLFRRLLGEFRQSGAMQASDPESLSNLSVHLTGPGEVIGRWAIGPVLDQPGAQLTLIGNQGRISALMPDEGRWTISGSHSDEVTLEEFDQSRAVARQITNRLAHQPDGPTWEDAVRCMDLADVAAESLRRGKTLSVHNERLTEEDTFKGMMAAGGCLILMALPMILVLMTLMDGLGIPIAKHAVLSAHTGQQRIYLPADAQSPERVELMSTGRELPEVQLRALMESYWDRASGPPQAFALSDEQLVLGPIPDMDYELAVAYRGVLTLGAWWPLALLVPIVIFLLLQLFKLVFLKPSQPQ